MLSNINEKAQPWRLGFFIYSVEAAGICHPRQPMPCMRMAFVGSQQCCSNSPLTRIRAGRGFISRSSNQKKKPTKIGELFPFVGGGGGN